MPTVIQHGRTSASPARRSAETSPTTVRAVALDSPQPPLNPDEAEAAALNDLVAKPLQDVHKFTEDVAQHLGPYMPRAQLHFLFATSFITVVGGAMTMACGVFGKGGACLPNFYDQLRAAACIFLVFVVGLIAYQVWKTKK